MSFRFAISPVLLAASAIAITACSEIYTDRHETIAPSAGDAMAANRVTHMIDPWPAASANRNIAFNGEKMQVAAERYRTGKVVPPTSAMTSSANYSLSAPAPPALTPPPAPPKP